METGINREIYIRQGMEKAEASGFQKTGLVFPDGAGLILKCTGTAGKWGLRIRQEHPFSLDLLKGYFLQIRSALRSELLRITDADAEASVLYIEGPAGQIPTGHKVRVDSGEPVPLMAARLLSGTPLKEALPSCDIRVGIDRDPPEKGNYPFILLTSRDQSVSGQGSSVQPLCIRARISEKGEILEPLKESEINRILQKVYQNPEAVVFIMLENSEVNPVHENILLNLLRTAGYRRTYASHMPDSILPVLPYLTEEFVQSCLSSRLDNYIQGIREMLDTNSSFSLSL